MTAAELRASTRAMVARAPSPTRPQWRRRLAGLYSLAAAVAPVPLSLAGGIRPHGRPVWLVATTAAGSTALAALALALGRGRSMLGRGRPTLLAVVGVLPLALLAWRLVLAGQPIAVHWPEQPPRGAGWAGELTECSYLGPVGRRGAPTRRRRSRLFSLRPNWLTLVGRRWAGSVAIEGGLGGLGEAGVTVNLRQRALLRVAGPAPVPGDQNRPDASLDPYFAVARTLEPLFLTEHPDFAGDKFPDRAHTVPWIRRFIEPAAWR
jgi:hypothetical protein